MPLSCIMGSSSSCLGCRDQRSVTLPGGDREQLDLEDERGARRDDATGAAVPVSEMGRNHQLPFSAHTHRADALVPTFDDAPFADREHQRLAPVVRRVELLTPLQPAGAVHADGITGLRTLAGALDEIDIAEAGCRLDDLFAHEVVPPPRSLHGMSPVCDAPSPADHTM